MAIFANERNWNSGFERNFMRVVLGGTFDPVHLGHLRIATELASALNVEHLYLMPCYQAVHKAEVGAACQHRLKMLQLALAGDPCLRLDEREILRSRASFTIDSLLELRAELNQEPLCLVIGTDAAQGFTRWHRVAEFASITHLVVVQRGGLTSSVNWSEFIDLGFQQTDNLRSLSESPAGKVVSVSVNRLEISSSYIRNCIRKGQSIRYLVTDAVRSYIVDNGLYLAGNERLY